MEIQRLQRCGSPRIAALLALGMAASALSTAQAGVSSAEFRGSSDDSHVIAQGTSQRSPLKLDAQAGPTARGPIIALETDQAALADLTDREAVRLTDFVLPGTARNDQPHIVEVDLVRMNVISSEAQFVVGDPERAGEFKRELPLPEVEMFRGNVVGAPDSRVFLSISSRATYGFVLTEGRTILISSGPEHEEWARVIYDMDAIPPGLIQWRDFMCKAGLQGDPAPGNGFDPGAGQWKPGLSTPLSPTVIAPCRRIEMAVDTDYEFTNDTFNGNIEQAADYVATLLGASSEIFIDAINVEIEVVFVRLWDEPDPWTASSTVAQLFEFRDYWNANMTDVDRHLAHYLSGRNLGGGVAWLNAVCHSTNGYGLSANLNGTFPYPLENYHNQNWDVLVVTHEIGHNFGTPHTHDLCPPLDECPPEDFWGSCQSQQNCTLGTIMGYCHLCSGGMSNVALEFHPTVKQTMLDYLDTVTACSIGCNPPMEVVFVPEDTATISEAVAMVMDGGEVIVSPGTYNEDLTLGGKNVHLLSTDGPEQTIIDASGSGTGVLRVLNAGNSDIVIEGFTFTGGSGSPVTLSGTPYVLGGGAYIFESNPTFINCTFQGNAAEFGGGVFNRASSPTFTNCTFENNTSSASGAGMFNFSSSHPLIEACVFTGNSADANGGGMSNQGSSPTITDSAFIDNHASDNGGGIRNIQSSAPIIDECIFQHNTVGGTGGAVFNDASPGTSISHATFCENEPNDIAGSFSDAGDNMFEEVCQEPPVCLGDINDDGEVDVFDLLIMIEAWGSCDNPDACPADLNNDGVVDVLDLLLLIESWGSCPG